MDKVCIVTGGGSGIGKAICLRLAQSGRKVIIVGRRKEKLLETQAVNPHKISIIQADLTKESDQEELKREIVTPIEFLIQNAAVLGDITHLKDISHLEWRRVMAINVDAPLFLTQILYDRMEKTRVLHISSGAAHYPIKGWGAYCASKAAFLMIYKLFKEEIPKRKAIFGSVKPGIVDTEMQSLIREANLKEMPHLQKFHNLYNENKLEPVDKVAKFLYWLLTETNSEEFSADEWDIREDKYISRWDN